MTILAIIGASYLQRPLVEKAKEMGLYTLCFAWAEGAVCKDLVDEFYPISIVNKKEILEIKRRFKKEEASFTRLVGCYVDGNKNKICKFSVVLQTDTSIHFYSSLSTIR